MKSKKAKEFIEKIDWSDDILNNKDLSIPEIIDRYVIKCIKIAEQDMMEKAIREHRLLCKSIIRENIGTYKQTCKHPIFSSKCDDSCRYMKEFINQLNS
jgi:hypothetical protein